mgnify:CR=1 FL=1
MTNMETSKGPRKTHRWRRRILLVIGILIAVGILFLVFLPVISPAFTPLAASAIESATGRKTELQHVSISILTSRATVRGLRIKEEDGQTDFAAVDSMTTDFQILPLLGGRIRVPSTVVRGVRARVVIDEDGRPNYQSILDHMEGDAEEADTDEGKPEEERGPEETDTETFSLPDVVAVSRTEDFQIDYADRQNDFRARLTNPLLHINIAGLQDITYESGKGKVEFGSITPDKSSGAGEWVVNGKAAVTQDEGLLRGSAEGKFALDGLTLTRTGEVVSRENHLHMTHSLQWDQGESLRIPRFKVDSQFLTADVTELEIGDPAALATLIGADPETIAESGIDRWKGQITGELRLRPLAELLGALQLLPGPAEADGTIRYEAGFTGQVPATLRLNTQVDSKELVFRASMPSAPEATPAEVFISSLKQESRIDINLSSLATEGSNEFRVTGRTPDDQLVSVDQNWTTPPLIGPSAPRIPLQKLESHLTVNLSALDAATSGLLPEKTAMRGRVESHDQFEQREPGQLGMTGTTEISAEFASPLLDGRLPLNIDSERALSLTFPQDARLPDIGVQTLRASSADSNLFQVNGSGGIAFSGDTPATFRLNITSDLGAARPYLDLFSVPVKIAGELRQEFRISSMASIVDVSGSGSLRNLSATGDALPAPVELAKGSWSNDLQLNLADGRLSRVKFAPDEGDAFELQIPGIRAGITGAVTDIQIRNRSARLESLTGSMDADFSRLPNTMIQRLASAYLPPPAKKLMLAGTSTAGFTASGNLPGTVTGQFLVNMNPLECEIADATDRPLVKKTSSQPMSVAIDFAADAGPTGWKAAFKNLETKLADFTASGAFSVDDKLVLSGPADGARFSLRAETMDGVFAMFPPAEALKPTGGRVNLDVHKLHCAARDGRVSGSISGQLHFDEMSLARAPELASLLETDPTEEPDSEVEETPSQEAEVSPTTTAKTIEPVELPEKLHKKIKGLKASVALTIGSMALGDGQHMHDLKMVMKFDGAATADQFTMTVDGGINPEAEQPGKLSFTSSADVSGEAPSMRTNYAVERFPITTPMLETVRRMTSVRMGGGLLDSVRFDTARDFFFDASGDARWKGVEWEAVRRSLVSEGLLSFGLPGGEFDLAADPISLLGSDAVKKLTQGRLKPLQQALEKAQTERDRLLERVQQIENTIDRLEETVNKLQKEKDRVKDIINRLKPLAAFSEDTREKLEEWEKKIDEYAGDLQEQKEELQDKQQVKGRLQEELDKLRERVDEAKQDIEKTKTGGTGLGLEEVLEFSFDGLVLNMGLDNGSPWPGGSTALDPDRFPISRLRLENLKFLPDGKEFPGFAGWVDLAGDYRLRIIPPEETLEGLSDNLPGLARVLREQGLVWTPRGLELPTTRE